MSIAAKQYYSLTEQQLGKLIGQGTYQGALAAWDCIRAIKEAGGTPKTFYSEFNGFVVFDDNDIESMQRLMSIESRSKQFHS